MRRIVLLFAFLAGVSSCTSCESCNKSGSNGAADGAAAPPSSVSSSGATAGPTETAVATPTGPVLDANASCRLLARAVTQKACDCPQGNKVGCCFFGLEPLKAFDAAAPHLDCSRGATDWPSKIEKKICADTSDVAKATAIANCWSAKDKLQCGRSPNADVGVGLPKECEALFTMIDGK